MLVGVGLMRTRIQKRLLRYREGMKLEEIKDAVIHLPEAERRELADWFEELEEGAWEAQMAEDFKPGARGAHLLEKVDSEIESGKFAPLEEGLRLRRGQHRTK
jgi:hypothetical protein